MEAAPTWLQGRGQLEEAGNPVAFSSALKLSLLEEREKLVQLARLGSLESYKIHPRVKDAETTAGDRALQQAQPALSCVQGAL